MCNWDSQHVRFSTLDRSLVVLSPVLIKWSHPREDVSYILWGRFQIQLKAAGLSLYTHVHTGKKLIENIFWSRLHNNQGNFPSSDFIPVRQELQFRDRDFFKLFF